MQAVMLKMTLMSESKCCILNIFEGFIKRMWLNYLLFRYGEKMMGTLNSFATVVLDYPLSALKDSARPAYWVPDEECFDCCVCRKPFDSQQSSSSYSLSSSSGAPSNNIKLKLHHCRQCGKGCCDDCSKSRKQVSNFIFFI